MTAPGLHARQRAYGIVANLLLAVVSLVTISPLLWVISTSFKTAPAVATIPPTLIPRPFSLSGYTDLWTVAPYLRFTFNSIVVAIFTAAATVLISSLAAYGMSRFRMKGVRVLLAGFLLSQMFPGASIIIPLSQTMLRLGIYNTRFALVLTYTGFLIPFSTWLLYGYFRTIPKELDEAALMDGARRSTILYRIILPVTLPGLGATFVFSILGSWNEFLFALVLTDSVEVRTLPLGIANLIGQWITSWNVLTAAGVIFSIPPLILFLFLEKALVSGLTAGAVKG